MDIIYYTAAEIIGDYCTLVTDEGVKNPVALFFLPDDIQVGSRVKFENFEYELC